MTCRFAPPAARAERHEWLVHRNAMLSKKRLPVERGPDNPREGVADVMSIHAAIPEELLLKGEDAVELRYVSLENAGATRAPRPGLRGDQVKDWNAHPVQLHSQPEVEVGTVGQDGCGGAGCVRG